MSNILKKFSQIQKDALLGKLAVMKDAEEFDNSFNKTYDENELIKSAVNQVAMEKLAAMIEEYNEKEAEENKKFSELTEIINNNIINELNSKMEKTAAIPILGKIPGKVKGIYKSLINSGVDEAVAKKLDDMVGASGETFGTLGSTLGASNVDEGAVASAYDKIRRTLSKKIPEKAYAGKLDDAALDKIITSANKVGTPNLPQALSDLSAEELNKIISNTQLRNKLLGGATLAGTTAIGVPLAAGAVGSDIGSILESIKEAMTPTEELTGQYPNLGGDLEDYLLGAGTGALGGLGTAYLMQGLGEGDWNPLNMGIREALTSGGTGAAAGALSAPLLPSLFNK